MSYEPSFQVPAGVQADQTTNRQVITFREDAVTEGLAVLEKSAGVSRLVNASDFAESALDLAQANAGGGAVFPTLGVAVVQLDADALTGLMSTLDGDSSILSVEPERMFYALGGSPLAPDYLRGYRDAVNHLYDQTAVESQDSSDLAAALGFADDAASTWGLKATKVVHSRFTGRGIRVAVLDTGMDLNHPDFRGRSITARSFVPGTDAQDRHGHGTHCIGTACGSKDVNGRRYGVASSCAIFAGKVLGDTGSGSTQGILAGIEWAISNRCEVISMSLGNIEASSSPAYEAVGRRALQNGCLIVAAAGNHRKLLPNPPRTVGQPANSPSIMAIGALDSQIRLADFSCTSGGASGANVDLAGPGVAVYSSVPMSRRYAIFSGTSMATPHVSGIAALYAEAFRGRGPQLWQLLVSRARRLSISSRDVGAGLVQAPV